MKITFEVHSRQPDVELIENFPVRHTGGAKQFGFGNFKKANVRAVEDYRRRIDITPAHAFFNSELSCHSGFVLSGRDANRRKELADLSQRIIATCESDEDINALGCDVDLRATVRPLLLIDEREFTSRVRS